MLSFNMKPEESILLRSLLPKVATDSHLAMYEKRRKKDEEEEEKKKKTKNNYWYPFLIW